METITKGGMQDKLVGIHFNLLQNFTNPPAETNEYNFDIVRDYYHWVQKQVDAKDYSTQWAKGAAYLVDELADAYQLGDTTAVGRFKEILYDKELPANTKQGWYKWDVKFIKDEQVDVVAPQVYSKNEGKRALNVLNDIARKEGFYGNMASVGSTHFIPSFASFGFSINKRESDNNWSKNFGALGRMNIPLLMLYPEMHKDKVTNVSEKAWKDILRANKAIDSYYKTKMKY